MEFYCFNYEFFIEKKLFFTHEVSSQFFSLAVLTAFPLNYIRIVLILSNFEEILKVHYIQLIQLPGR